MAISVSKQSIVNTNTSASVNEQLMLHCNDVWALLNSSVIELLMALVHYLPLL